MKKLKLYTEAFLLSILFSLNIHSQDDITANTLTIESPAEVAGSYPCLIASFGPQLEDELIGEIILGEDGIKIGRDGCEDVQNNINGKLVVVERGMCNFADKIKNIQDAGGIAAIVGADDRDGDEDMSLRPMTFSSDQVTIDDIQIPAVYISRYSMVKLLPFLEAGISLEGKLEYKEPAELVSCGDVGIPYIETTIWGQNGEGEFRDSLGDWTIECASDTCWGWTLDEFITAPFTSANMVSPTSCNGFVVFNSDYLDNAGVYYEGIGFCSAPCAGSLISPIIEVSDYNPESLFLRFTQNYRDYESEYNIAISYDDGLTYPDIIPLNEDAIQNGDDVMEVVEIPIQNYNGQPTIRVKFDHIGNYYYWAIDDVSITTESFSINKTEFTHKNFDVNIYPNPANDIVFVDFMLNDISDVNVELSSMDGIVVQAQTFYNIKTKNISINVSELHSGVYSLSLKTKERIHT